MSLLRRNCFLGGASRRPPKAGRKKPSPARQEWDSTIHDLTVHRATPEDIALRHEMHKSKNKALVHLELQEKLLKSTSKKLRPSAPKSVEKKKIALMREIISNQYQLQDVLERADQAMAVVKDLFGDAPQWHLGFPNVTVAPDYDVESSQGPIVQKTDPPTQLSILNESVMDPQALNEAEECSFVCKTNGVDDVYPNTRSSTYTNRVLHLPKEEDCVVNCQEEASKQQVSTVSTSEEADVLLTPAASFQSQGQSALNATNVVKRAHSRFPNEEHTPDTIYAVHEVLNGKGRKQKHTSTKVKKKQTVHTPAGQMKINLSTASTSITVNGRNSSLEYLNQRMYDMEHEMEEYERWMGHKIQCVHSSQGVSGFTHSLVKPLCRMLRCLKETETKVRQEIRNREQLKKELSEHRALIDALTAEVLLMREENLVMQNILQQNLVAQDEQSFTSVPPVTDSGRMTNYGETGEFSVGSPEATRAENPISKCVGAKMAVPELLHADLPRKSAVLLHPPDKIHPKPLVSSGIFQPAVMLAPPLQKGSQASPLAQDDYIKREPNEKQEHSASHQSLVVPKDVSPFVQRDDSLIATKPLQNSPYLYDHLLVSTFSAELGQGDGDFTERINPSAIMMSTQNDDLQQQIAELTLQNSLNKSQLSKFKHYHQETSSNLQQPFTKQDGSTMEAQRDSQAISKVKELPKSLDERIAELNRQSAEARGKLLLLTKQEILSPFISVSPPVSPIPSPPENLTENRRQITEVSVPVAETLDSSKEDMPFPVSGSNARREAYSQAAVTEDLTEIRRMQEPADQKMYLPQSISLGNVQLRNNSHRIKTDNPKEEGWFALSTHIG
ncbi:LOW QUALITY PROTEIN: spindle and centriole-associated protein 1 [Sceloporus undulatus]|uniref:LOW QUALITY PROTEIN: spindle and centriole-associated protein 1 n=1 Tax=Sceloporus undulatus TaxID=8520 RepID=UPI001C4DD222|nr:LOW QUALITY PROTEIN: spindle and centriole-associated protein 1 [Sceloporus undulatus]